MTVEDDPAVLEAFLKEFGRQQQVLLPVAIWLEAVLYGLYTCLFIATCRLMLKKKAVESFASRVFLLSCFMTFILASIHNGTALYRLVRAYAQIVAPLPIDYFNDYRRWDNFSHLVILALVTWIGDVLVIYRCYLIWRRNAWVIAGPVLLLLGSMVTTAVNWHWFKHPEDFEPEEIIPVLNITFPLNLAQNILTTGLISFKIYRQYSESRASGLQLSSSMDLLTVVRIIVESAMVYTAVTTIIIILFFLNHPAVVIPQYSLPPIIGIVFCLMAIRTHVARYDSTIRPLPTSNVLFPSWISENEEAARRRTLNIPLTVTTITDRPDSIAVTPGKRDDLELAPDPDGIYEPLGMKK